MKSVTISENEAGIRVDKYIKKHYPLITTMLLYKYFRLKRIKINKKKCDIGYKLQNNDLLELYVNDELLASNDAKTDFLNASSDLSIVYEDENIMLLDKQAGLLCHPDNEEFTDTLIARATKYLYENGEFVPSEANVFIPSLCNRIDRNTAGIVILAKTSAALRFINEKIKLREIDKEYLCVVHGVPAVKSALLEAFLYKDSKKNIVFIEDKKTSKNLSIKTEYNVLSSKNNLSLLKIKLLTGRTHQIRAQLAHIGHPLLGDGKYSKNLDDRKLGYKYQTLYSYKLSFAFNNIAEQDAKFSYLNKKEFVVKKIWFVEKLFPQTKID